MNKQEKIEDAAYILLYVRPRLTIANHIQRIVYLLDC